MSFFSFFFSLLVSVAEGEGDYFGSAVRRAPVQRAEVDGEEKAEGNMNERRDEEEKKRSSNPSKGEEESVEPRFAGCVSLSYRSIGS